MWYDAMNITQSWRSKTLSDEFLAKWFFNILFININYLLISISFFFLININGTAHFLPDDNIVFEKNIDEIADDGHRPSNETYEGDKVESVSSYIYISYTLTLLSQIFFKWSFIP